MAIVAVERAQPADPLLHQRPVGRHFGGRRGTDIGDMDLPFEIEKLV